jgi:fibronectin type 3 domain-containing protein
MSASSDHFRSSRRGYVLPAVLMFLAITFGLCVIMFRSSATLIRVEQARVLRQSRASWTAMAMGEALRLLESGTPPITTYQCKLSVTQSGVTKYFLLTYANGLGNQWTVSCAPSDASDTTIDAPLTFAVLPGDPSGLAAVETSTSQINLSWTDVAHDIGYQVERSLNGSTGWTLVATTAKNVITFSDTGLGSNVAYYYRVLALGAAGSSGYSNVASATTLPGAPGAPTGLTATAVSTTQINLSWNDVTLESGYQVERSLDGSTGWTQVGTPGANVTSFSDTGLSPNTTYYYRVRATNLSGNSPYSSNANATTQLPIPASPTGLAAAAISTSQLDLSWSDVSFETTYKIERSLDGSSGWTQIGTTGANVTTYSDTGLSTSTTYYYRVLASNAAGDSGYSSSASATTDSDIPNAPTDLVATVQTATSVTLDWTDNSSNETGFRVQRSNNGVGWSTVATTAANATTYTVTGLTTGQLYYLRVRANGAAGNSSNTSAVTATPQ